MKRIITIIVTFLLCVGALGGSFALFKHFDEEPSVEKPVEDSTNDSSNSSPNDDINDSTNDSTNDSANDTSNDTNNDSTDNGSIEDNQEKPSEDNGSNGNQEEKQMAKAWKMCTDVTELNVGDQIVIVAQSSEYALGDTQNTNNRSATVVNKNGHQLYVDENIQVITLEQGIIENTFAFNVGGGYLYAASSSSNWLKTHASIDENSCWALTIDDNGSARIQAQGANSKNVLMYNATSKLFSCYSSTQNPIVVYKLVETDVAITPPVLKDGEILITDASDFRVGETYRFYLDKNQPNSEVYIILNLATENGGFNGWFIEPGETVQLDLPNIKIGISNAREGEGYIYWGDMRISVDAEVSSDGDYLEIVLDESIFSATGDNDKLPEIWFELKRDTECIYIGCNGGAYLVAVTGTAE